MILVAVTGGIGAGKTTVLDQFAACGAQVADADALVHRLYEPGTALYDALCTRWGQRVMAAEGRLSRPAIAEIVFSSASELQWLNETVHPQVRQLILALAEQARPALFCAIPLLHESGWETDMSSTVAVWCDPLTQRQRLARRGWDEHEIERRLRQQISMDEKLRRSDFGIINNGSRELLAEQCRRVYQRVQERCGGLNAGTDTTATAGF